MLSQYPVQFGSYQLVEKIGQGGMAEIFRAETRGPNEFTKELAIKRILPSLAHNDDFITQFLDEARIAGSLSHPNIVQIYDVGQVGEDYYIAMEYIKGKHLGQVIRTTIDTMRYFPSLIACCIINEIGKALAFAHSARDSMGNPLHIIHRDISPQNVMIALNGSVKLTDFGIAKAANRLYQTTAGVIKGKFSYLAPEQLTGAPATPSSDLFALGVVLWELLAGRRLFQANSDIATIQMVQACKVPSLREIRNDIHQELEDILAKILTPRPEQRYQNAEALVNDLSMFLSTQGITEVMGKVSNFMASLYPKDAQPAKALPATAADMPAISPQDFQGLVPNQGNLAPTPPVQGMQTSAETRILEQPDLDEGPSGPQVGRETAPVDASAYLGNTGDRSTAEETIINIDGDLRVGKKPKSSRFLYTLIGLFVVCLAVGGTLAVLLAKGIKGKNQIGPEPMEKASIEVELDPPGSMLSLNGVALKSKGKKRTINNLIGGIKYQILASHKGYKSEARGVIAKDGETYWLRIKLKPLPRQVSPERRKPKKRKRRRRRRRRR